MKIVKITDEAITFDNGNTITFDHDQDCCEWNYADFMQIDEKTIYSQEFDDDLMFEVVEEAGFRFGSHPLRMIFVPCYSVQNGYYTDNICIYYNEEQVLSFSAELRY